MAGAMLEAATSTALHRTTAHAQYNGRALGVVLLNNLVPITLHVPMAGRPAYPAILVFGRNAHKNIPYADYGIREKCCRQVLTFNLLHYTKCYLTDDTEDGPYQYNCCRKCGATLKDSCNHLIQTVTRRSYSVDRYIFKATKILHGGDGNEKIFTYQTQLCPKCLRSDCHNGC